MGLEIFESKEDQHVLWTLSPSLNIDKDPFELGVQCGRGYEKFPKLLPHTQKGSASKKKDKGLQIIDWTFEV